MKKPKPSPSPADRVQVEIHKRRDEFLWNLRRLARLGEEEEFKSYLTETCGVRPDDPEYEPALSAFWNAVSEFEREL
jgi:hypothetical protein